MSETTKLREITTAAGRVYQVRGDESDVRIDWSPPSPVAGFSVLTGGEVNEDRNEGTIVTFDEKVRQGRKTQTISARVKGRPDLADLVRLAEAMQSEIEAAFDAAGATAEPIGYHYVAGCDTGNTYDVLFADGLSDRTIELAEFRLKTDLIEKHLHDQDFRAVAEATGAETEKAHMMSYGGFRFDVEGFRQLLALATHRQAAIDAVKAAQKAVRDAGRDAKIREARETGQPVEIERWSEGCDGSQDECDMDIISRVAMPDGSIVTHRSHTH